MTKEPIRICEVEGSANRLNDMVYAPPWSVDEKEDGDDSDEKPTRRRRQPLTKEKLVIFFGGDIQDFRHELKKHPNFMELWKWSLEDTASILQSQFQNHHILVIRPVRYCSHISCFDNFVYSNNSLGIPFIDPSHNGLNHLLKLLRQVSVRLSQRDKRENVDSEEDRPVNKNNTEESEESPKTVNDPGIMYRFDLCDITLVGFSKGCAVLNQLIAEFNVFKFMTQHELGRFMRLVTDIYWLDSGHQGNKSGWVTSPGQVQTLFDLQINVHIHLTPYQMSDPKKMWLVKEEKEFTKLLKKFKVKYDRTEHFTENFPTLKDHFKLLITFKKIPKTVISDSLSGSFEL